MAIIYSYPTVTPKSGDLIIGTDITGKVTKNFTVGSIVAAGIPTYITGTANTVPLFTGSNTIGDSIITQDSGANGVGIGGDVQNNRKLKVHGHSSVDGNLYLSGDASDYSIEVGQSRTTEGVALLDLTGEIIPDDYGLRMIRYGGENAESAIIHTGTSNLRIRTENSADTVFENTNVGIGTTNPQGKLDVDGSIFVKGSDIITFDDNLGDLSIASSGDGVGRIEMLNYTIIVDSSRLTIAGTIDLNDGNDNTIIGTSAGGGGNYLVEQIYINAFGKDALQYNTGENASGFGVGALRFNSGNYTSGFGNGALDSNIGDHSSGFGHSALRNNTGTNSNGFGSGSLSGNTGDYSNGFGRGALTLNTGNLSNGFGAFALSSNTGASSSGFGHSALQGNIGNNSNGFGWQSLQNNTGTQSNGFGNNALRNNTGVTSNGFGSEALQNNTGASSNGFGDDALQFNTGNFSNGFGNSTLRSNSGSGNTAIGSSAGSENDILTGNNNTFLGADASYGANSAVSNSTAVGASVTLTDSNTVILGNNADVGIGTTSPSYKLDVSGTGRFTSTVTATNFILSSDEKLKTNIKNLGLGFIDVKWKEYELNSEEGQKRYGVIAQELEVTNPEFVRTDEDGIKSVAYIDLLVAKIAELEARIQTLESN